MAVHLSLPQPDPEDLEQVVGVTVQNDVVVIATRAALSGTELEMLLPRSEAVKLRTALTALDN